MSAVFDTEEFPSENGSLPTVLLQMGFPRVIISSEEETTFALSASKKVVRRRKNEVFQGSLLEGAVNRVTKWLVLTEGVHPSDFTETILTANCLF